MIRITDARRQVLAPILVARDRVRLAGLATQLSPDTGPKAEMR